MRLSVVAGLIWFLLLFFTVAVFLSAALWAIGSFGNNYTQSVNGKKATISSAWILLALSITVMFTQHGVTQTVASITLILSSALIPSFVADKVRKKVTFTNGATESTELASNGLLGHVERVSSLPLSKETAMLAAIDDFESDNFENGRAAS